MDIPKVEDLLPSEARATVKFHPRDPMLYPRYWFKDTRFDKILHLARWLPPSIRGVVHTSHLTGDHDSTSDFSNWDEDYDGYDEWAYPEFVVVAEDQETYELIMSFEGMHVQTSQYLYGKHGDLGLEYPEIQIKKMFAAPIIRSLKSFEETDTFQNLGNKLFVLLIELLPLHTSFKEDRFDKRTDKTAPRVWRVFTCYGDTNLDSLHDQVLVPVMGWRRHYHSYEFIIPTSGAKFGSKGSDSLDVMHRVSRRSYFLDSEKYDLRHVLRRPTQRLIYIYDLGDYWHHQITLVGLVSRNDTISSSFFKRYPYVTNIMNKSERQTWTLVGGDLLAGELNCPPEDSVGCGGYGPYYSNLLAKGPTFIPKEFGINWMEHGIVSAFSFDLKAHRKRLKKATRSRRSPQDGALKTIHPVEEGSPLGDMIESTGPKYTLLDASHPAGPGSNLEEVINYYKKTERTGKMNHRKIIADSSTGLVETLGKTTLSHSICANCGKQRKAHSNLVLRKCNRCKSVHYCSKECQREHWKSGHREKCTQITSQEASLIVQK